MACDEGLHLRSVVVCAPEAAFFDVGVDELAIHNFHLVVDAERATEQHKVLVDLLESAGAEVMCLDEPPGQPNAVYVRDTAVVMDQGFVHMRMGLAKRRPEARWMAATLSDHGFSELGRIEPPGTVEGGDVILAGAVAFVGLSSRTNRAGARQMTRLLEASGYAVRWVSVPAPSLHLGGLMSVIGPQRLLVCTDALPPAVTAGFEVVSIARRDFISGNVITLGPGEVIVEHRNEPAISALLQAGVRVHSVDLSEFVKGGGGPSCLILPLARGQPVLQGTQLGCFS